MTDRPLRDQFKNLLDREQLRDEEFAEFETLLGKPIKSHTRFPWHPGLTAAITASLLLFIGAFFYILQPIEDRQLLVSQRIAEEVLANHINIHPLDLKTSSMEQVRLGMDRLNFIPVSTKAMAAGSLNLLGARYCTLQGVIATQLMFFDEEGGLVTFYQAAYDPERFGPLPNISQRQEPLAVVRNGVNIHIWLEQGVVIAQAR